MRRQPRPRIRRRWIVFGGILLVLFISINSIIRFYTDLLWFGELGFTSVFWKVLSTRVGIGVVGGLGAGLIVLANLEIARRAAPRYRFVTPGGDVAEQYRSVFRPYARLANFAAAAVVAFFTGLSTSAVWDRYLLWRNARPFGIRAPKPFGHDVSFYVFGIPFQRTIISWLFGIIVVSLLFSALAHLLNGSIQPEQNRVRVATLVKAHVSVLLGLIALLKAWAYRLDSFDLVFSPRGFVTGASYTDVHAQLPALKLLTIIAVVAALIFFANVVRFRGWLLPGAAIALWAFSSILMGAAIPAAVQRFTVKPNESERERPYIKRDIAATRIAFGLDKIRVRQFPAESSVSADAVAANEGTISNVRVWDPSVLQPTYQRLQAIRSYYDFDDVDIDRYQLNGRMTQVMLAGREVDSSKISQNWINTRLTYTHGYGVVANQANAVTSEGLPSFIAYDLPQRSTEGLDVRKPGLYFGERDPSGGYAVVNTKQKEIDYPRGEQQVVTTNYAGKGGIPLSNATRRLAFALRFGDTDLLISNLITPKSRVMMRRNILERVQTAAPFLRYDRDPYLVSADGKLSWVLDAYTTTDRFPYSQRVDIGTILGPGADLRGTANYVRNSVKVVIDAYDGTTKFYVIDPSDAMAATYQAVFPDLFESGDKLPAELRAHLRYPEDLFKVQAWQYRAYHILDAQRLYEQEDVWDIANNPVTSSDAESVAMDPYYVVMKLPGEKREEFLLMLPFTPKQRQVLNGWVAARMDPGHYGELIAFSFPRGASINGPENVAGRIEQNSAVSQQFTLWNTAGSQVERGNLYVLPIGKSLIYVRPIYLRASKQEQALPELKKVIVVNGDRIGFESTFEESLAAAVTGVAKPRSPNTPSTPSVPGDVSALLAQAARHFQAADDALKQGDLATYQKENLAARRAVEEAQTTSGG